MHVVVEMPDETIALGHCQDEGELIIIQRNDKIEYHISCKLLIHIYTVATIAKIYGSHKVSDLIHAFLSFITSMCVHSNELLTLKLVFIHSTYLIFYILFVSVTRIWVDVIFYGIQLLIILNTLFSATIIHYS